MKKFNYYLIATVILFLFSSGLSAQSLNIKPGSVLTYEVDYFKIVYPFIVTVVKNTDSLIFSYEMEKDLQKKGAILIRNWALQNSTVMMNGFSGGKKRLDSMTTVWVSKFVYDSFIKNGKCTLTDWNSEFTDELLVDNSVTSYSAVVNGKEQSLDIIYASNKDSEKPFKIWLLKDDNNYLILKMDLGWTVALKEFKE